MSANKPGNFGQRPKAQGIHHANIRDKEQSVKRLKAGFRKAEIPLTLDKNKRRVKSTAVLTEIMPRSAYLFVNEKIAKGSLLTVHLKEPLSLDVRGRVRYCELADRNVSVKKSSGKTQYRMLIEFSITSEAEQGAMEDYYQQVRDENYVATKWHHYISEKSQQEAQAKMHELKLAEKMKEAVDEPILASDDMLVTDKKGNKGEGGGSKAA